MEYCMEKKNWLIDYKYKDEKLSMIIELSRKPDITYILFSIKKKHIPDNVLIPSQDRNDSDEEAYKKNYQIEVLSITAQ